MVIPLLSTKYNIPPVFINRIERHHLLQKMDDSLRYGKQLILVCAPAGYGKSTLVGEWVNWISSSSLTDNFDLKAGETSLRVAWLTCEQEDGDLARFLSYLTAALRQVDPHMGEGLLASFHAAKLPAPQVLATLLINDLAKVQDRLVLVLDDYHTISSKPIDDFLTFLIEHQPPRVCLLLVTRADPALPLARWRGRGIMDEIRQNELAFTLEESADFISRVMGISLTQDQLVILENRTEGWAAGLQLAALSMQSTQDMPAFIAAFSGGHEYIADYLAGEVLAQQSDSTQSFLLKTSILDHLSGALCTEVTGDVNAAVILESLREKNLFLVALDHQREWYRYHALFADLLRNRLHHLYADQVDDLHLRASHWYHTNGLLAPAIEYALAGHAVEYAAALLEQVAEQVFTSGLASTLLRWLELLPEKTKDAHAVLWIFHGLALIWCGKSPSPVTAIMPRLTPIFEKANLLGEAYTLQALCAMADGNTGKADQLAQSALQVLSSQCYLFRCLTADTLGMVNTLSSDIPGAIRAFEQTAEIASLAGYGMLEITALSHLAGLRLQQGKLRATDSGYRHVVELADNKLGKRSPVTASVLLGLGEVSREWNDLDRALTYFLESVELFAQFSEIGISIAYLSIALVKAHQGDWASAHEFLEKARQVAQASQATRFNDRLVAGLQARFWIMCGELGKAEQWAQENGLIDHPIAEIIATSGLKVGGSEFIFNDYLNLAHLYLAQNKADSVLEVLEPLQNVANSLGLMRREIQILVLKALTLQQKKEMEQAVGMLGQALALAAPEGYQQVFLGDENIVPLLYQAVERGYSPAYAKKLLTVLKRSDSRGAVPVKEKPAVESLLEPLSNRELEVLTLIAGGLSNREISARLHISLSTVKGHTANIYGKLGVNSRTQAISEAVRLGILNR